MVQVKNIERRREHAVRDNQADFLLQNSLDEQRLLLIRRTREEMQQHQGRDGEGEQANAQDNAVRKSNGRFSESTNLILETWYVQHLTDPYLSNAEATQLAQKTGLSVKEVKKWLDNRRNRDGNSKKKTRHHPYK
jgi:hypothetical protein